MFKTILIITVVTLFLVIALLHFYWALGGKWGVEGAIPEQFRTSYFRKENHFKVQLSTIIVAMGLCVFASIIGTHYLIDEGRVEAGYTTYISWGIAAIFIIRAIGDFNYVGMFKKYTDDKFYRNDTRIYVPLCLFIGIAILAITIIE